MMSIKDYEVFRKASRDVIHKIIDECLKPDQLMKSARLLGIVREDIMVFKNEDETDILMDFALHEYKEDDKNLIAVFKEKVGGRKDNEKEIVDAMLSSYTSLFKITSVSPREKFLLLRDLLNEREDLKLWDIGLSQSAIPGYMIFIRLVPLKDAFMTSGISFVFPPHLEKYLLRKHKKLSKKTDPARLPLERFLF
jgi:hypothetical protein